MKMQLMNKKTKSMTPQSKIDAQFFGDLQETAEKNMGEKLKKIKEFEDKLRKRWAFEGDGGFYFSICFTNTAKRDLFLDKNNIKLHEGRYVFAEDLPEIVER